MITLTDNKAPFEKIVSLVERKKIYAQAAMDKSEITLKLHDHDDLYAFFATPNEASTLLGKVDGLNRPNGKYKALVSFTADPDRYFFNGTVSLVDGTVILDVTGELFKLQRRKTMRVTMPDYLEIRINVTQIDGEKGFVSSRLHDISGGGIRFYCLENPPVSIRNGSHIKGVLHISQIKSLPFEGTIRHVQEVPGNGDKQTQTHYGLEFAVSPDKRMLSLSFDLQSKAIQGRRD